MKKKLYYVKKFDEGKVKEVNRKRWCEEFEK